MARLLRVLAVLALLASCRSFDFERERVFLRYTPETDVLDALLVYEGVGAVKQSPSEVESALRVLRAIGEGRRHVILFDWPFDFDLDDLAGKVDPEDELAQRFFEYQLNVRVLEARLLLDARQNLCLIQRVQVREASACLRLIDAAINRSLLAELGDDPAGGGHDLFDDPPTRERMRRRAEAHGSWARFDGGSLVVSIPMTPQAAATQLRELLEDVSGERGWKDAFVLDSLSAIQIDGEQLCLTFAPAPDGWIAFTQADPERTYRPTVAEELTRLGLVEKGELASEVERLKALR